MSPLPLKLSSTSLYCLPFLFIPVQHPLWHQHCLSTTIIHRTIDLANKTGHSRCSKQRGQSSLAIPFNVGLVSFPESWSTPAWRVATLSPPRTFARNGQEWHKEPLGDEHLSVEHPHWVSSRAACRAPALVPPSGRHVKHPQRMSSSLRHEPSVGSYVARRVFLDG